MSESEADFLQSVLELAELKGWLCFHSYDSRKSCGAGFPDLVMVRAVPIEIEGNNGCELVAERPPRLIFAEIKSEKGRLSKAQMEWLEILATGGWNEVYTWRPSQWEVIMEILK